MRIYHATIRESLRTLNPALFEELSNSGELETYVEERAANLADTIAIYEEELLAHNPAPEDYLARVRHLNAIRHQAEEQALAELVAGFTANVIVQDG